MPLVEILIALATALIIVVAAARLSGGNLDEAAGVAAIIAFAIGIQRFFDPGPRPGAAVHDVPAGNGRR